jgi:transcriptional regulator with XRE-family HTH domain
MAKIDPKRAKILGGLIRDARTHTGKSFAQCAQILGITVQEYEKMEAGEYHASLPDLEALALFFKIPMGYFWGSDPLPQDPQINYQELILLRQRVIGVLLSQMRLRARRSRSEIAEFLGIEEAIVEQYETGATAVPYLHLEQICRHLNSTLNAFMDDLHGPLARHETQQKLLKQFERMTPEMRAFLTNPVNVSYLETARKLSEMDVSKLRQVATDLLEITF